MKLEKNQMKMEIVERRGKMNTKIIGFVAVVAVVTLAAVLATSDTAHAYRWYQWVCNYWGYCWYEPRCF